jgi:hypothetical protein
MCTDFLIFARDSITSFGNMSIYAERIIRAEEENTVIAIQTVIMSLETPVRCIPLTFIAEWLARKRAGSTTASRGVMRYDVLTPKQR